MDTVVKRLRKHLEPLPEGITDEELLKLSEGSLSRALIELECAYEGLLREIAETFVLKWVVKILMKIKWYRRCVEKLKCQ